MDRTSGHLILGVYSANIPLTARSICRVQGGVMYPILNAVTYESFPDSEKPHMQLYGCTYGGKMETHMELRIWRGGQILPTVHRAGVPPSSRDLLACDCLSIVGLPPTPVQRYLASFPPGPLFSVPEVVPFPNIDLSAQPPPSAMAPTHLQKLKLH